MRKMALVGTAMALVMTLAIVVPAFGAPPTTIPPVNDHHKVTAPLTKGMVLTISGSGTACKNGHVPSPFSVGDHFSVDFAKHQSKLAHQSFLDLSATVTRSS